MSASRTSDGGVPQQLWVRPNMSSILAADYCLSCIRDQQYDCNSTPHMLQALY